MRSIIEEIAEAEARAEEIRSEAAQKAREQIAAATEAAEIAAAKQEETERVNTRAALSQAEQDGAEIARELTAKMANEADALCREAESRMGACVANLLKKVQRTA